jgi:hypothetical protein
MRLQLTKKGVHCALCSTVWTSIVGASVVGTCSKVLLKLGYYV